MLLRRRIYGGPKISPKRQFSRITSHLHTKRIADFSHFLLWLWKILFFLNNPSGFFFTITLVCWIILLLLRFVLDYTKFKLKSKTWFQTNYVTDKWGYLKWGYLYLCVCVFFSVLKLQGAKQTNNLSLSWEGF